MARLLSIGYELNANNIEWETATGAPTVQNSTVRTGTYAGQITSLSSATRKGWLADFAASNSNGPYYVRVYVRFAAFPSAENRFTALVAGTNVTGAAAAYLTVDNTGVLRLYDDVGVIGSPSSTLALDTWYRLGLTFDRSPAAGSQVVRCAIDGVEFAGAANRTITNQVRSLLLGGNLNLEAQTSGSWFFDDIALNDSTGSFQNSLPGAGAILHLLPDSAGDNANWARGGADSGANWSQVDETSPNDATDYLSSNTLNQTDDFNLAATPAAIGSSDTINVVHVGARLSGAGASSNASFVLRIKASAAGTTEESSNITPAATAWRTWRSTAGPIVPWFTLYDLPGASTTAFSKADLDTTQIGLRCSAPSTNAAQVTALWAVVDFTAAGGGGGGGSTDTPTLLTLGVG